MSSRIPEKKLFSSLLCGLSVFLLPSKPLQRFLDRFQHQPLKEFIQTLVLDGPMMGVENGINKGFDSSP